MRRATPVDSFLVGAHDGFEGFRIAGPRAHHQVAIILDPLTVFDVGWASQALPPYKLLPVDAPLIPRKVDTKSPPLEEQKTP